MADKANHTYPDAAACLGQRGAALLDRMARNACRLADARPALRPIEAIFAWAEERRVRCDPATLVDLAERLRGSRLLFAEDGALAGTRIVDALREQAGLMRDAS